MSVIFLHPDGDIAGRTTMSGSEIRKMLPAEALVRAISQTTGMKFGNVKVGLISGRITPFFIYVSCDIWYNIYRHNHVMRTKKGAITERNVSHGK